MTSARLGQHARYLQQGEDAPLVIADGYSGLVIVDHEARHLLLREVTRPVLLGA